MGASIRHTRRMLAAYREQGASALAHGNRGLRAINATPETTKAEALRLARSRYPGTNHTRWPSTPHHSAVTRHAGPLLLRCSHLPQQRKKRISSTHGRGLQRRWKHGTPLWLTVSRSGEEKPSGRANRRAFALPSAQLLLLVGQLLNGKVIIPNIAMLRVYQYHGFLGIVGKVETGDVFVIHV